MILKIRSLALMLFLVMLLFSGVVQSEEVIGINGKPVQDGKTVGGIYYGKTFGVDNGPRNLFIGGILQSSPNPDKNDNRYKTFADQNQAIYVPTYYSLSYLNTGNPVVDTVSALPNTMTAAIDDSAEVNLAATGHPTYMNGLKSPALQNQQYDTIMGYSGGTATAITALLSQKVTCDTLILISPMKGTLSDLDYKNEITKILTSGAANHIVVIWSPEDKPTGPIASYEAQISSSWDPKRITVYRADLPQDKNNGLQAHKDIFFDYAMTHIKGGKYVETAAVAGTSLVIPQPVSGPTQVALTLTVGGVGENAEPRLYDAEVTGQDAAGNSFTGNTDSNGVVILSGQPGTWQFMISKEGYDISKFSFDVTKAYNAEAKTYNALVSLQKSAANPRGSGNSVVGTWNVVWNLPPQTVEFVLTFNNDGTFNQPSVYRKLADGSEYAVPAATGRWTQNGDSVSWDCAYPSRTTTFVGTIHVNSMNGVVSGSSQSWSAEKTGTDLEMGNSPSEPQSSIQGNVATTQGMCSDYPDKCLDFIRQSRMDEALACYQKDVECYNQAISQDPSNSYYWYMKGNALDYVASYLYSYSTPDLSLFEDAIEAFDRAIELGPSSAWLAGAWNEKGVVLEELGRFDEAKTCFDKAIEINPNFSAYKNNKDRVLAKSGS
jgi:hypothetical protein